MRVVGAFVTVMLVVGGFVSVSASAAPAFIPPALIPPDLACTSGRVAITFDDGPHATFTPRLLAKLRKHRAQATFYLQGHLVERRPGMVRQMIRDGHAVANHSWDHPNLTKVSSGEAATQLRRTSAAIRSAISQRPGLFRPPYGATNSRIASIARDHGMRQQLWTIDTRDWARLSSSEITKRALIGLRKHRRNVILMHDGVANSAQTVAAVPAIIKGLRKRGYCLVPQQRMMAFQRVSGKARAVREPRERLVVKTMVLHLDGPAQRPGRVRVVPHDGTAKLGVHYRFTPQWVHFARGDRRAAVKVRILRADDNVTRTFALKLTRPKRLVVRPGHRRIPVTIRDNGVVLPVCDGEMEQADNLNPCVSASFSSGPFATILPMLRSPATHCSSEPATCAASHRESTRGCRSACVS